MKKMIKPTQKELEALLKEVQDSELVLIRRYLEGVEEPTWELTTRLLARFILSIIPQAEPRTRRAKIVPLSSPEAKEASGKWTIIKSSSEYLM